METRDELREATLQPRGRALDEASWIGLARLGATSQVGTQALCCARLSPSRVQRGGQCHAGMSQIWFVAPVGGTVGG